MKTGASAAAVSYPIMLRYGGFVIEIQELNLSVVENGVHPAPKGDSICSRIAWFCAQHALSFPAPVAEARRKVRGPAQRSWLAHLDMGRTNPRAALTYMGTGRPSQASARTHDTYPACRLKPSHNDRVTSGRRPGLVRVAAYSAGEAHAGRPVPRQRPRC